MDGYAFAYQDYVDNTEVKVSHTVQAGDTELPVLRSGEAARIFTGAPVPKGTDTVVMQEKVQVENGYISFQQQEIKKGLNIRLQGSQSKKGDLLVPENTKINSGIIGLLAGFGISKVAVYSFPEVGIVITGNELAETGKPLKPGQIYESNSSTLQAALQELHLPCMFSVKVKDDKESTYQTIKEVWEKVDVLLITGGISVGDYDFVQESLERLGTEKLFYKIQQKPGKPLYFGKKGKQYVFALPGNPASVFTCFYQYVRPFLEGLKGRKDFYQERSEGILDDEYNKRNTLSLFLKASEKNGNVKILSSQESYKMDDFVQADCLVELTGEPRILEKGEKVVIWKL